ncbi:MAG: hypothetical protein AABX03_01245 [Nanoarchaeota archaeon]
MAKLTAWILTIIGILLLLSAAGLLSVITDWNNWLIAIGVLVIGISKIIRSYKLMKK